MDVSNVSTKKYYNVIVDYFKELIPEGVDSGKYLNPSKKTEMSEIFYLFCLDLQDFNMRPNVIGLLKPDRRELFRKIFLGYDKDAMIKAYSHDSLYDKFCESFPVKNKESKGNLWRQYAQGVMDICKYLERFKTAEEFNSYIEHYNGSLAVGEEMVKAIKGVGFAISMNIIKDLGFTEYAKPDTHIKDTVAAMGFAESDDKEIVKIIQKIARDNNDTAFNVDRMIWLICSGNYFEDNVQIEKNKDELISRIKSCKKMQPT